MKVFNGKQPAAVEVEAQRGKVEAERAVIRAQQNALEAQIADAYGTDTDTDVLAAQYAALEAKLTALALVERRLQGEKVEAAKRAALADYKRAVEAGITDWLAGGGAQDWIAQEQRRMHGKANGKPPAPERPLAEVAPARHAAARTVALVEPVDEPFSRGGG